METFFGIFFHCMWCLQCKTGNCIDIDIRDTGFSFFQNVLTEPVQTKGLVNLPDFLPNSRGIVDFTQSRTARTLKLQSEVWRFIRKRVGVHARHAALSRCFIIL